MSEIINLRHVRKAKRRAVAASNAATNRLRHGRDRAERTREAMHADQARRLLDGARLDPCESDDKAVDGD